MTFEPAEVTVHSWRADDDATGTETTVKKLSHVEFKRRLPHGKQGDRLASLIGAAAISGAAVAPSMGPTQPEDNKRTTCRLQRPARGLGAESSER